MKWISTVFLFLMILSSGILSARQIEIAYIDYPPYEFMEKGQAEGVAVRVIREVLKRMKTDVKFVYLPWNRALQSVKEGKIDAIFTIIETAERKKFAEFISTPLIEESAALFVLKDSSISFDGDLSKLKKYKIGAVRGFSYGKVFDNAMKGGIISVDNSAIDLKANINKLLGNRFDIMVGDSFSTTDMVKKMKATGKIRELKPIIQSIPTYIAFSKKSSMRKIRVQFDRILKK